MKGALLRSTRSLLKRVPKCKYLRTSSAHEVCQEVCTEYSRLNISLSLWFVFPRAVIRVFVHRLNVVSADVKLRQNVKEDT